MTVKAEKAIRAACYVRMSSDRQEDSPEQQKARLTALGKQRGYKIVKWYQDAGISGLTTRKRPEFQRMMKDAEAGAFDVLLAWDMDRLSRQDSLEASEWAGRLQRGGVKLETITQGAVDLESFVGRIQFALNAEMGNQYLHKLSQAVGRGKFERAKRGILDPHQLYGYDRVIYDEQGRERERVPYGVKFSKPKSWRSKWEPATDPASVNVVREIFTRFTTEDVGPYAIAVSINARGIPSPMGGLWTDNRVIFMLSNPAYMGTRTYGRFPSGKLYQVDATGAIQVASKTKPKRCWREPQPPCVAIEDNHPPLISRKMFEAAQAKMKTLWDTRRRPRVADSYLLSGLVVCGDTQVRLAAQTCRIKSRDKLKAREIRYMRLKPSTQKMGSYAGQLKTVRADAIEGFVLELLSSAVLSDKAFAELRRKVEKVAKQRRSRGPVDITAIEKRIAGIDAKIRQGTERLLLVDAESLQDVQSMLAGWRADRDALRQQLQDTTAVQKGGDIRQTTEKAIAVMKQLRKHLKATDTPAMREVIRLFVEKVELFWGDPVEYSGHNRFPLSHGIVTLFCVPQEFNLFPRKDQLSGNKVIRFSAADLSNHYVTSHAI